MPATSDREQEIQARLGKFAFGAGRDVRVLARALGDERLLAAVTVMWGRRGWIAAASDSGLRLAWASAVLGRPADAFFEWSALTDLVIKAWQIELRFGDHVVELKVGGPGEEAARLVDVARDRLGLELVSSADTRALAVRKLGKLLGLAHEYECMKLPELLEPGEQVSRLAMAKHEFEGLLALTDRRLLLLKVQRPDTLTWAVDRERIIAAKTAGEDLHLLLRGSEVTLTSFMPPERALEFAAAAPQASSGI